MILACSLVLAELCIFRFHSCWGSCALLHSQSDFVRISFGAQLCCNVLFAVVLRAFRAHHRKLNSRATSATKGSDDKHISGNTNKVTWLTPSLSVNSVVKSTQTTMLVPNTKWLTQRERNSRARYVIHRFRIRSFWKSTCVNMEAIHSHVNIVTVHFVVLRVLHDTSISVTRLRIVKSFCYNFRQIARVRFRSSFLKNWSLARHNQICDSIV